MHIQKSSDEDKSRTTNITNKYELNLARRQSYFLYFYKNLKSKKLFDIFILLNIFQTKYLVLFFKLSEEDFQKIRG